MTFMENDDDKPMVGLLPPLATLSVARALTDGAVKYSPENWANTPSFRRYYNAALRHMLSWAAGEDIDPKSGETHLAHAICSLLFIEELQQRGLEAADDRFRGGETADVVQALRHLVGADAASPVTSAPNVEEASEEAFKDIPKGGMINLRWTETFNGELVEKKEKILVSPDREYRKEIELNNSTLAIINPEDSANIWMEVAGNSPVDPESGITEPMFSKGMLLTGKTFITKTMSGQVVIRFKLM